jgi:AcrR family transcriptional regulator
VIDDRSGSAERPRNQLAQRRAQHRQDTRDEIERIAREHMAAGTDPGELSLRAIAREMGVSPAALYGYFADKDALITALIAGAFDSLTTALAAAPADRDARQRLLDMAMRYRAWALEGRVEYRMLFGTPVPGYHAPSQGPTFEAASRFGDVVRRAVRDAWPDPTSLQEVARPAAINEFFVRYLGRLHGLVSLEVAGYLHVVMPDLTDLYRRDVAALLTELDPSP